MKRQPRPIRGPKAYDSLPPRNRDTYGRTLDGLNRMRRGKSIKRAAREAGTTPETMRRYVGEALEVRRGRTVAKPADRLYRRMSVLTPDGRREVGTRGSEAAKKIAAHWNATEHYLATGDTKPLAKFKGKRVGGVELATRPSQIETHWTRGEMDLDDIYVDR